MQATSRYRFRLLGPGPTRIGVSSAQTTPAMTTSALISMFARRTAPAASHLCPVAISSRTRRGSWGLRPPALIKPAAGLHDPTTSLHQTFNSISGFKEVVG